MEVGRVVEVRGDLARVEFNRRGACGNCSICTPLIGDMSKVAALASNPIGARVGDSVEVELTQGNIVAAAFIVYILPLIALFFGFGFGKWWAERVWGMASGQNAGLLLAAALFALAFFGIWLLNKRYASSKRYTIEIKRVVGGEP
ncbi:MAG: SoxR reducing system RseC family protein [bacterium]